MIEVTEAYLTPNQWSRPKLRLRGVYGIIMHWVEHAGTSAMFNRNFFERRRYGKLGYGSAHFIVDLSGEVVVCIPPYEIAYHCGENRDAGYFYTDLAMDRFGVWPNNCTLGIELCHLDTAGQFTEETLGMASRLCACLCEQFDLDPITDILRHFDITTKPCPRWFVNHGDAFDDFKSLVKREMIREECG